MLDITVPKKMTHVLQTRTKIRLQTQVENNGDKNGNYLETLRPSEE